MEVIRWFMEIKHTRTVDFNHYFVLNGNKEDLLKFRIDIWNDWNPGSYNLDNYECHSRYKWWAHQIDYDRIKAFSQLKIITRDNSMAVWLKLL
jgi:hypothetical protein